jgi:monoamine oxidase
VLRQVENDTRGHVSELLEKAINQGLLDQDVSKEDRARMLDFLRTYGPLDDAGKYAGSDRAGYAETAGAGDQTGVLSQPIDMHTLLDGNFWQNMLFDEQFDMQATMFQPVGGMDRIPYAFAKVLGNAVKYNAPVTEIRKTAKGVRVGYTGNESAKAVEADYCICTIPLTILKRTPNDFSAPYTKVINECSYASAYKIAWESRRFWEQDYNIFGGLEFVNQGCSPIWFPSAGMFTPRGVLVSGYTDESHSNIKDLPLTEKFAESRKSIERLHPGHGKELEKPMYVTWGQIPHNEGSWIRSYGPGQDRWSGFALTQERRTHVNPGYETLIEPDGPIIFAGDHVSHIVAWQEGAALSALRAVGQVNDRVKASKLGSG